MVGSSIQVCINCFTRGGGGIVSPMAVLAKASAGRRYVMMAIVGNM